MAKPIKWTDSAKLCRRNILEFWVRRTGNKKYSKKLAHVWNQRLDYLKEHPELGKETEISDVRTTACGHFSIFFINDSAEIIIVGIYDTRDNPEKIVSYLKKSK